MYTLLSSLGVAVVCFVVGALAVNWWAGFVPALLGFGLAFYLLSRRTMAQVQAIFGRAQALAASPPPQDVMKSQESLLAFQTQQRAQLRDTLKEALAVERWQFLVKEQVYAQLGMLDYQEGIEARMMDRKNAAETCFGNARMNLELAWHPQISSLMGDWRSRAVLAAVHHRASKVEEADKVMKDAEQAGSKEPMFWGLWAFILNDGKKTEEALQVIGKGLTAIPTSDALKKIQEALTNKRRPDMTVFGDAWYQYFPEDIPMEKRIEMAKAMGLNPQQQQQGQQGRQIPRHTWPQHPRR